MKENNSKPALTILKAWLIVGTLDIICACIWSYLAPAHRTPDAVLISIGRFVIGSEGSRYDLLANEGLMMGLGLFTHYLIAFIWTIIFYLAWPKVKLLQGDTTVVGLSYGLFIWAFMTLVVLPVRSMTMPHVILKNALIGAFIIMVAIGVPLSWIIGNYYRNKAAD